MFEKMLVILPLVAALFAIMYWMLKNTLLKDLQGMKFSIDSDNRKLISTHIRKS